MAGRLTRAHGKKNSGSPGPNEAWLALHREDIIDPTRPLIDAHHHMYDRLNSRYLFEDLLADVRSGHNIRGTVFIDAGAMFRADGPEWMKPVGEVEFANSIAARSATGDYGPARLCAGIISFADLTLGDAVGEVLDAQMAAGGARYRGIRVLANWDAADGVKVAGAGAIPPGLLLADDFRTGFRQLAKRNLVFDAWVYHPQLGELTDLARAFPDTTIVMNHVGGLIAGSGPYAGKREEATALWKKLMAELATCPNVFMKLGGRGMPYHGYGFHKLPKPPDSTVLAAAWKPVFDTCVELFGPKRCMFESNFPPDKQSCSYATLWNAFKRYAAPYSESEKHELCFGAAARGYRLNLTQH